MSQRGKRPNSSGIDNGSIPVKRRKGRPPTNASYIDNTDDGGKCVPSTSSGVGQSGGAIWQPRPGVDIKMSSIYNRSAPEAPAELFRKDLISAMKLPDSEPLSHDEYWVITDQWKQEWERGVQVPVNPDSLPEPVVKQLHENYYKGRQDFKLPKNKYIRITKDENFSHDKNYLSNTPALADSVCSYDLDQMDEAWLKVFNGERSQCGLPAVNEEQFERIIEELEIRCHDKIQAIMKSEEGLGIEYDENVICDVCRSPDSEEANEMVFCDNCNICVHQACYGITMIPSGQWLCRTCSMGQKPDCVLCPNKGGAMKSTRSGQKWAHVSCALWIPEVSIGSVDRMEPITKISSIPSSRWQLLCVLCREKVGACIQCSVKTCKTAYHVTCAFQHGLEMRAIIEDENAEDGVKLRSYCQKHSVNNKSKKEPKATNNEKGSCSEEEDKTSKKRIRKDMTSEERSQVRVQRSLEIEAEFDKHVSIKDISCHLLDVDQEGINHIYNYWILKRKAGGNRPLLLPKSDDVDVQSQNQEQADFEKMKMFVHLRQDLERVRNLCYMVSRRQKLSRSYIKMREQIFHKQISILSKTRHTEKLDETCLNAICEANHGPSIYDVLYSSDTISANIKQMPIDVMIDAILGNNNINNNNNNNNNSKNKLNINKSTGAVSSGNDINIGTTNNNSNNNNNNNKKSTQDRYKLFNGSTKRRNSSVIDSMSTSDSDSTSRSVREARRKRKERSHHKTSDVSSISSSSSQSASTTSEDDEPHPRQKSPAHSITAPKESKKKVRSPIKSQTSTESTSRRGRKPNAASNFNNNNKNKYSFDSSSEDDSIHVVPKSRSSAKMPQQNTQKSPRSMTLKQMEQELDHTNLSDESDELIDIKNSSGYSIPTGNSKRVSTTAIYSDTDSSTDKDNKTDNTVSDSQQQPFRTKAAMKEFNIQEFNKLKKSPGPPPKSSSSSIPSTSKQDVKDKDKYLPPPTPINSLNDVSSEKQSSKDKSNAQNKSTKNTSKDFITDLLVVPQREAAKKASENLMRTNASLTSQSVSGVKNEVEKPRKVDKFDEIIDKEKVRPASSHDADKFERREERHDKESKKNKSVKENKRPGRPSTNEKRQKDKDLQQQKEKELQREKEQKEKEEREKREFSEIMAQYVPQRQAAKKAAEHIKSGLVKTIEAAPTPAAVVGKEVDEKPTKQSSSTPTTQNAPKRREERKPTLNLSGSSSDSSSSSGSGSGSGSSSSSSSESETESPKKTQDQKVPQKQLAIAKSAGKQPTTISSSSSGAPAASVKSKTKDSPFLDKVAKPSADHTSSSSSSDGSSDSSSSECDSSPGSPKTRSPVKSRRQSTAGSPTKKSSQQTSKKQSQSGGLTSKKDNENINKSIPKVSTPKSEFETGLDTTKSGSNKTPIRTDTKSQISSPHQTAKASPSTSVPNKMSSNKSRTSEPSKGDLVKLPDKRKSTDLKDLELPPPAKPVTATETVKEFTEPPRRGRKPSVTSPPAKVQSDKSDTESKPTPMQRRGSRAESQMQLQKEKEQKENERKLQLQKEKEKEKQLQKEKEEKEKEKREKEQREKEQREKERLEKEQKEKERKLQLQKEKEEKERLQKEKEEKEKQRQLQLQKEKEQKEKEKREKEQKEKEKLEKERLEKERLEKERLEKEEKEKERREKEEKEKREKEQKAKEEEEKRKQAEKMQRDKIQAESEKSRKDKPNADNVIKKISNEKDVICIDEGEDMDIDESINQSSLIVENLFQKDYIKSHVEHVDTEKTSYDLTNFTRTTTVNATTITETVKPNKAVLIHESPQESASKTQDLIETLRRKRTGGKGNDVTVPDANANNNAVLPENNSKEMNFNHPAGAKGKQNENFIAGFPNKNELRLFEMSPQEVVMSAKAIDIRSWTSNKKEQQIKKSPYGMGLQNENDNQNTNYAMNRDSSIIAPGNKNLMDATNVKPIISDCMVEQQQLQMQQKQQLAACQKAGEENLMNRTNTSNMFMSPPQLQPIPNRACSDNIVLSEKLQQMHALSSLENSHMLPGNKQTGMMGSDINMMNDNQNCMKNKEHMQQFPADMNQQQQQQQQQTQQQSGINEFGAMHAGMHGGLQTNFNSFNNFGENHYPSAVSLFPPNMNVPTALPSPGQAMYAPNFNNQFSSSSTHPQNTTDHPMMMLPKSDEMQQMNNNQMNYNMSMCQQGSLAPPFSTQLPTSQIMQTDMSKNMSPFTESNNKIDLRSSCEKTPKSHESKKSPSKLVRASPRFSNQNFDEQQNSANSTPVQSNRTPQKSPSKSPRQPVDPFVKQSSNKGAAKAQNEKGKKSRNNSAASTPPSNSSSSGNNRGKGRGRGRGRVATPFLPMPNEFDYPQKLAGTVYDFNDDDLSHPNVENFRAMRDRQKSIEYYNKIHRDVASESPKFSLSMNSSGKSPFMKSATTSSNLTPSTSLSINNHTLPNSLVNDASSINQQSATASSLADVNPVLPGPVDMRTYSSYDSNEAYNSQLLGAFASNTVDQQLQEIDEEMEKELHSALKASSSKPEDLKNSNDTTTTTITSILSVAEQNVEESVDSDTSFAKASLSDSRNQLKLKIKGPLANPEQHSSSSHQQQNNVQSNILPIPMPAMLNPSIGTTGSTNQRRMRKKELLRQYCAQDMNMEEQSNPQSTDLPATNNEPIQSTNRTTGFPRAVDSMSLLSTKDDFKDYANTDFKKRRKLTTMSRELRLLTDKLSDPMTTSNLFHNSGNQDSDMTNELNSKRRFRQRNQQQQEQQSDLPQQQMQQKQIPNLSGYPPKLKIKIGNSDYIETMGASDLSGRPPKKRILPSNQTSYQDYKRESMNFRKKMFGEFNEKKEKHHRSKEEKRMRKEEKRKKKKEKKGSIEIISNVGENSEAPPKLIIRFGNKPATSTTTSPQSNNNSNINNNNNNSASNNNSTANATMAAPTDTSGNVTVTPIRLKIARNSEGSGYCLSTKNNPQKDKKEKKEKDPSAKNKKKSKDKEKKNEDKVKVKEKEKDDKKKDKEKEEVKEKEESKEKGKEKENEKEKEKENIEEKSKEKEANPANSTIESSASTTTIVTSTPKSSVSMLPPKIDTVDISNLKTKKLEVALERLSWNNPSFSNVSDIKTPSQTAGAKKQRMSEESPTLESILKTNKMERPNWNTSSISNVSDVKTPSQTAGAKKQIATEESPSNMATPTTNPNSSNKKPINNPSTEDCEVR